jgi:hypothetical protein
MRRKWVVRDLSSSASPEVEDDVGTYFERPSMMRLLRWATT